MQDLTQFYESERYLEELEKQQELHNQHVIDYYYQTPVANLEPDIPF